MSGSIGPSNKSLRSKWHRAVVTVIAASRREANLTQEQLADRIGWHRSKIAKIEAGERRLDVAEFITIAGALKIEPATLFFHVLSWGGHEEAPQKTFRYDRPPVLSKKALAYGKKIAGNRELAIKFLKEGGFIEQPGKLHRNYR